MSEALRPKDAPRLEPMRLGRVPDALVTFPNCSMNGPVVRNDDDRNGLDGNSVDDEVK